MMIRGLVLRYLGIWVHFDQVVDKESGREVDGRTVGVFFVYLPDECLPGSFVGRIPCFNPALAAAIRVCGHV